MRISSLSYLSLGLNGTIGVLNAYANPTRWISGFAIGLLAGIYTGKKAYQAAIFNSTAHSRKFSDAPIARRDGLQTLLRSMPGIITTIVNIFAFQMRSFALGSSVQRYSGDLASATLGYTCGQLFYLDKLRNSQVPDVVKAVKKAVV